VCLPCSTRAGDWGLSAGRGAATIFAKKANDRGVLGPDVERRPRKGQPQEQPQEQPQVPEAARQLVVAFSLGRGGVGFVPQEHQYSLKSHPQTCM